MSRATTTLNALKAENLLAGSYVLTQIESLRTNLKYRSNGDAVSFDDFYLKLQKEVEDLPRLQLMNTVATGTENQYIMQLVKGLETIFDDADRVVRRVIHFQSKLQNAVSQVSKLRAAFNAWYSLAAGEALEDNGAKFPSNQLKDLASSEFSRLMENLDVEVDSLLAAVKVQTDQIKQWKKTQQDKFNLGKDQANASWTSGLPNFGESGGRADQLLEKGFAVEEEEEDNEAPAFVSQKPRITPDVEEAVTQALADNRLAGLPKPSPAVIEEIKETVARTATGRPTLEELQKEIAAEPAEDRADAKGTFFKRGDAKPITPVVSDEYPTESVKVLEGMDLDKAAPVIHPPVSLTDVFANATEVTPAPALSKLLKAKKVAVEYRIPCDGEMIVLRDSDPAEKIKCTVCDRRIRSKQEMFSRDGGFAHANEGECTGAPTVHRVVPQDGKFQFQPPSQAFYDSVKDVDEPGGVMAASPEILAASGGDPNNQASISVTIFEVAKAILAPKAEPGTLLEQLETGATSVLKKATTVLVPSTTSDNPPETQPLETAEIAIPNVDAPATPRKRLTFLDEDQEIM